MPLHLHVNQKSDYDEYDHVRSKSSYKDVCYKGTAHHMHIILLDFKRLCLCNACITLTEGYSLRLLWKCGIFFFKLKRLVG